MTTAGVHIGASLSSTAEKTAAAARQAILSQRQPEGFWWADLKADTTLESDYILLQLWLHRAVKGEWHPPTRSNIDACAQEILRRQLADGGFSVYPGGPADVSATVKAYFALKVAGLAADQPAMQKARATILALGGLQAVNSYTKINLSFFGLYPDAGVPQVPAELLFAGDLMYRMSAWTRAIVVPLSIVQALSERREVPEGLNLDELLLPNVPVTLEPQGKLAWRNFFLQLDKALKWYRAAGFTTVRKRALQKAERWMQERLEGSDGLGAIFPAMMYSVMALEALGYGSDDVRRQRAEAEFERLVTRRGEEFFVQPCFSPVWDTAIAAYALGRTQGGDLASSADWLVSKEVRRKGDWSVRRPNTEPSGWYFEFANEFYPDIDDTAMVLLTLSTVQGRDEAAQAAAVKRGLQWLCDMQSSDGGWAAFDVDCNWQMLNQVPFADHNAMLDPTCPDITGRVLEALGAHGYAYGHAVVKRGVEWLVRNQQSDGSWYGRWGVNYLYGTCFALRGLAAVGESDREVHMLRATEWLRAIQNSDGGWGESCASYDEGTYVNAPSTASQTAWALLGLMAGGDTDSISVHKGIEYLVQTQLSDGTWAEQAATGTGFPRVFYLEYGLYRNAFPLLALAEYARLHQS